MRNRTKSAVYAELTELEWEALRKARDKMRLKHMAYRTQGSYCRNIAKYMIFIRTRLQPGLSRKERIEAWLSDFARRRRSASTQNVAFNSIKFFFENVYDLRMGEIDALRARVPDRIRIPPEREDIVRMLSSLQNSPQCHFRTLGFMLYGLGLRISEALRLRRKDLLVSRSKLVVREGKGGKDRLLDLPPNLLPALQKQLVISDAVWQADHGNRVPVPLPNALALKYPANPLKRDWAWVFPSVKTCVFEGRVMRYHMSGQAVRQALGRACEAAGISRLSPHVLRHGFASDFSGDLQLLQKVMGHKNIETTMGYRHLRTLEHTSPIDGMVVA